ncbi:MAG: M3 family metallopeptidase, partial [Candidatus Bathyarchaeota archaeon]
MANNFERAYKGKIANFTAKELLTCIKIYEKFETKFSDIALYSSLSFAANMTLHQTQSLYDKVKKLKALIGKQLTFFELELGKVLKRNTQLVSDPILDNYSHMLERIYRDVKHQLSEIEEQLIIEKDQFGIYGWKELQSKWLNTRMFEVTVLGEKKKLSYAKVNGLITHPDRETRKSANKSIYGLLGKDGEIFSSALRNICNDWINNCKRRKYNSPIESSLISNDTDQKIIDNLLKTIEENSIIYRRYLKLKAKLLILPKLENFDIMAPLPDVPELKYTYRQAQKLITKACDRFDTQYTTSVKEMFSKKHIDADPRYGKRNGAFCASYYNGKSAYILTSFNGTLSDVFTLAHELGHATHDWYSSRNQTILNMDIPSIIAETASIFGELLL